MTDFTKYSLRSEDENFSFANIYANPVPQQEYAIVNTAIVATKTVSFTVYGASGNPLTLANVAINGVATAKSDILGRVTLPNVPLDAEIVVSYLGLQPYSMIASAMPSKITLQTGFEQLNDVQIPPKPKAKTSSNAWLWLIGLGGLGAVAYMASKSKPKNNIVKATI